VINSDSFTEEAQWTEGLSALTPDQIAAIEYESDIILDFAEVWHPHSKQALVLQAVAAGKKIIFIECGRKWGKTDILNFILHKVLAAIPYAAGYFIAPLLKQARELVWENNRLQNFFLPNLDLNNPMLTVGGHPRDDQIAIFNQLKNKYYKGLPNNSEMRQRFNNGSFFKLDGADSYEAYRGVNPHVIVYDEFKDHHPKFHKAMDPNLATYNAILFVVGTPPEGDEANAQGFYDLAKIAQNDPDGAYFNFTSFDNPHISSKWLEKKKKQLFLVGRDDEWWREYMAKRIRGGSKAIFPMYQSVDFDEDVERVYTDHVRPDIEIRNEVLKHYKDWDYVMSFDPASSSTFAVLFLAIHKRTKQIRALGEIYETKKGQMGTKKIYPKAMELIDSWGILQDDVRKIYDNAAAWFAQEVADNFGDNLEPCLKSLKKKDFGLNLMKDIFAFHYYKGSDECPNLNNEISGYRVDEKGKIPKENDHLIDNFRYALSNTHYNSVPEKESQKESESGRRGFTPDQDMAGDRAIQDPFAYITDDFYDDI
jgi:hypothetical protein